MARAQVIKADPEEAPARHLRHRAAGVAAEIVPEIEAALSSAANAVPQEEIVALLGAQQFSELRTRLGATWDIEDMPRLLAVLEAPLQGLAVEIALVATAPGVVPIPLASADYSTIAEMIGRRIVAISTTTREAIQGILARTWQSGQPIHAQAHEIRQLVGLTPTQAETVQHFREGLVTAGEPAGRVASLVDQRAAVLIRQRALAIARTETITAASQGQQMAWQASARTGLLDLQRFRRHWLTAEDEATCLRVCVPIPGMNPNGVALDEPFQTPIGLVMMPAAHVNCRCTVVGRF